MEYFSTYASNTLAGSGNQSFFTPSNSVSPIVGRSFFKIFKEGCYHYSVLFSNIIDSTYSSGEFSHKNIVCDQWEIDSLKLGICNDCNCETMTQVCCNIPLTFQGRISKRVMPGEFFHTDEILLDIKQGQYICLEIIFHGTMIPCHPESLIPTFVLEGNQWTPSKNLPVPGMIGCDRSISRRIAFLGDSITQGIGTANNSYTHWNAVLSQKLGCHNAYWNLGLGFGRADDAASNGAWLFKAKQCDTVFICFGVNDILQGFSEQSVIDNLKKIVDILKKHNIQLIVQTVPPFDYDEKHRVIWENVNTFIKTELSNQVIVFDNIPVLSDIEKGHHVAKYGGHPNEEGCAHWAQQLYAATKDLI